MPLTEQQFYCIWKVSSSHIAARITIPNRDVWSIDATVMILGTTEYLVYSSFDGSSTWAFYAMDVLLFMIILKTNVSTLREFVAALSAQY